jgi:hypothetical protein
MINTAAKRNILIGCSFVVSIEVAERWSYFAARGHAWRDYKLMKDFGGKLISCSLPAYRAIGHYYTGMAVADVGHGDCLRALWHYEQALKSCPAHFLPRLLLAIGSVSGFIERDDSNYRKACLLVSSLSPDVDTFIEAQRGLAILDDNRSRGLERLLSLYPMVKQGSLHIPADWANSVAVELLAAGKVEEAKAASIIALASPYAPFNPEWHKTAKDIEEVQLNNLVGFTGVNIAKGQSYTKLLLTLEANYPRYSISDIERLTVEAHT